MKKTMLLLAGSPGTGKSYLGNLICQAIPNFFELTSIDQFKEQLYEQVGFDNLDEKTNLDNRAYKYFYQNIKDLMHSGQSIISDYPFSYRQHDILQELASQFNFQIITITLVCDLDILYERQKQRDLDSSRPLGFVMNHYHHGDKLQDRAQMEIQKTRLEFEKFNELRGYSHFHLGKTIFLDVSDFKNVDYPAIIAKVKEWIV